MACHKGVVKHVSLNEIANRDPRSGRAALSLCPGGTELYGVASLAMVVH